MKRTGLLLASMNLVSPKICRPADVLTPHDDVSYPPNPAEKGGDVCGEPA